MIIAVDGPAASGKGTIARRLAARYGLHHLDTGLIYRAVAKALMDQGAAPDDHERAVAAARALDPATFGAKGFNAGPDGEQVLRSQAVGEVASRVSQIPEVRALLLAFQRAFAATPPGAVLDGRDIGTVIVPKADVKFFVIASPEERAKRRARELRARGEVANEAEILAEIVQRDERDTTRAVAPLRPATDAHLLDTTHLDIDAAVRAAVDIVEAVRAGRGAG
jgi:CMP/dCMP kinase